MSSKKTIIQFPHPGGQHTAKSGTKWNTGIHKRKYLKVKGSYLKRLESKPINATVCFWGEWEAPSLVKSIKSNKSPLPKYIFEPCYTLPVTKNAANTDPFIFGDQFFYCICKQGHYLSLRNLEKGDMILFGSNLNKQFVLDTVFVIKDWCDYEITDLPKLKKKFNNAFFHTSLEPIINSTLVDAKSISVDNSEELCLPCIGDNKDDYKPAKLKDKYRIYKAVMYDDKDVFNGIFSYTPCLPDTLEHKGFTRPFINHPILSQELNQGIKIIKNQDVGQVWNEITTSILNDKLDLMINNVLPQLCKYLLKK
jgi:hypothetical protein